MKEYPDFEPVPGLPIYRFDSPLIFSNAEIFSDELRYLVREADPPVSAVIINCEMIHDMDTTAADELLRQSPAADQQVEEGTTVTITVSKTSSP